MDKLTRDAVVAGAARGDPGGPGGADRVALRLVGADRRLGRRAPASRPAAAPRWRAPGGPARSYEVGTGRSAAGTVTASRTVVSATRRPGRRRRPRRGASGVVTGCGSSAGVGERHVGSAPPASASACSAEAAAAARRSGADGLSRPAARRRGVGRLPVGLVGCAALSFLATEPRSRAEAEHDQEHAADAVLLLARSPLSAAALARGDGLGADVLGGLVPGGEAAAAAPAHVAGDESRSRASDVAARPCRGRRATGGLVAGVRDVRAGLVAGVRDERRDLARVASATHGREPCRERSASRGGLVDGPRSARCRLVTGVLVASGQRALVGASSSRRGRPSHHDLPASYPAGRFLPTPG